jgi:hypothetical protein
MRRVRRRCRRADGPLLPVVPSVPLFATRCVTNGVATCARCQHDRRRRETEGRIADVHAQRIIQLLQADVSATVTLNCEAVIVEAATRLRLFEDDPGMYEERVVADVQQTLHDDFIDSTWPACPQHPNHPLWFSGGWWRCVASAMAVAELGRLPRRQ